VTLGLLFATKVTGPVIFFFTAFLIAVIYRILGGRPLKPKVSFKRVFTFLFLFFVAFWACYLFKTGPAISSKTAEVGKPYLFYIFENKPFWLNIFKKPLPFIDYLATLKYAVSYQKAGFDAYFAGNYSRFGWWWYFVVIFLLKTPLPLIILFFVGVLSLLREVIVNIKMQIAKRYSKFQKDNIFFYFIPIVSILFLSLFVRINIGLRHILSIYPFLIVMALFGWHRLWAKGRGTRLILSGLLLWYLARTIYFLPHLITFTNEFLPPDKSYKILADSNLSWGQELFAIKRWQKSTNQLINKSTNQQILLVFIS